MINKSLEVILLLILFSLPLSLFGQTRNKTNNISLKIDGSQKFQMIDGIGINANTRSWDGVNLEPALDLLVDSLHATVWRVIVETVYKWETKNDNNDPFTFNWDYYNKLYETKKFRKAWNMIQYLNNHGITDHLMINFMGPVPLWMGGKVVTPKCVQDQAVNCEDEYVEMLVSFFYYAIHVKHLKIGLISIMNEPDIQMEGPTVKPDQYVRLLRKFIVRMDSLGMGNIKIVGPDVASMNRGIDNYIPAMMKDSLIMSKLAHFGLHSYGGYYASVDSALKNSSHPESNFWVTEWNKWCDGCDEGLKGSYNYNFAEGGVEDLLELIGHNARAGMYWEAYDSYYEHHAPSKFSYWGMLAYDPETKTYHPRKTFYAVKQVSKFISPGTNRIGITGNEDKLSILAFFNKNTERLTIVGINKKDQSINLRGSLNDLPGFTHLQMYYTSSEVNFHEDEAVSVSEKAFDVSIPENCIFTLTGTTSLNN